MVTISPIRCGGMPMSVSCCTAVRYLFRRVRFATIGPCFQRIVAGTYVSRTRSATAATCCHHDAASPSVYGVLFMSSIGYAPRTESWRRNARTFALYVAFASDHGVARLAPNSSFSTITGFGQPIWDEATSYSVFAFATIVDGSAGVAGWPTRALRCMSQ